MEKRYVLVGAVLALAIGNMLASGKSALTAALELRRQSPLPFIAAEVEKENARPKIAHPLTTHLENPKLLPPHLQNFLTTHLHYLNEHSSAVAGQETDPELELLAASSPSIAIPTQSGSQSPLQKRFNEFAKALDLAVKIQKRLSPATTE